MDDRERPTIGRTVLFYEGDDFMKSHGRPRGGTNGTRWHPAVITRVWSDTCVNLHVMFDASPAESVTSVVELPRVVGAHGDYCGWRWAHSGEDLPSAPVAAAA